MAIANSFSSGSVVSAFSQRSIYQIASIYGGAALRAVLPSRSPILPVCCPLLYPEAQILDVGVSAAPAVGAMAYCLPIGASMGLAGWHCPAFTASASWHNTRAVRWGCAPRLICILLSPHALQLKVSASGVGCCSVHDIRVFSLFFGKFGRWQGIGPRLNPAFLSTTPVCPVVGRTHAPLFRADLGMDWGLWQVRGSLVLPRGEIYMLDFHVY